MSRDSTVGFTRLNSKQEDIQVHQKEILGVSYEGNARWKKKTMYARCGVGVLTIICTILMIALLLTFELNLACNSNNGTTSSNGRQSLESAAKFLLFSDLHLDDFYDDSVGPDPTNCRMLGNYSKASYKAPYGRVDCDSPLTLIDSMLKAAKGISQDYNFALMTGDFSAHKMDRPYFTNSTVPHHVLQNIALAVNSIRKEFPSTPVFPILGNNDLPDHYVLPLDETWYNETLVLFAPLILCSGCPAEVPKPTSMDILEKTYLDGGYYSVNLTTKHGPIVLIVLNTMYWNVYASTGNPVIQAVARRQMAWFHRQLKQAKINDQKVIIASHIAPGIDPFNGASFWLSNYTDMYIKIVTGDYRNVVAGQFFAHIHKDDFHLQTQQVHMFSQPPANTSFAIFSPSVSPVYSNNPSFRVVYIDEEERALLDYDQYYLNLVMATEFNATNWQFSYRFSEHYPSSIPYINADRIYELNQGLLNTTSDKIWLNYIFSRTVNYQPGTYSRFQLYCAMRYVFNEGYQKCISKYNVPGG
ncbi:acid sphingomyelinase-like phosphodiesterase 3a isoform X2 [Actinia tenebrosa]|uniref:Acid sphingomyelinase-like phosphodiesterase 3a isoform X2 n=1 Tax=Actinia tenebrosa TaxID=6105 RepID=A0A6P8HH46_ACTTE|nr:acid sphingomyelinase-like phosphodiesterase 3a isoform X2 [Actinia tenebrosa]